MDRPRPGGRRGDRGDRCGRCLARTVDAVHALGAPRFVDETAASGIAHTTDGGLTTLTGGGVAVFDCDGDRRPDVYLGGRRASGGAVPQREPAPAARSRFARVDGSGVDLDAVTGAYPLDVDADGVDGPRGAAASGGRVLLRGLGRLPVRAADAAWPRRADRLDHRLQRDLGGRRGAADPGLRQLRGAGCRRRGRSGCADNELFRPAAAGDGYAAPVALAPGYCTLSILFSDWDGSGRRDLRVSNDRHYYARDGQEQLWRVAPGEAPREYTAADGWASMQIWGMGIASRDLTGDGLPEVYLTSQGDNKLQTLLDGPAQPAYARHRAGPRRDGDPAVRRRRLAAVDRVAPGVPGRQQRRLHRTCSCPRATSGTMPDYASATRATCSSASPTARSSRAPRRPGSSAFDRGRGAALVDLNLDGLLDLVAGQPRRARRACGATSEPGRPTRRRRWATGSRAGSRSRAATATRSARWSRCRRATVTIRAELIVGGGHIGGQLRLDAVGSATATEADVRVTWPDGEAGPWLTVAGEPVRGHRARRGRRRCRGRRPRAEEEADDGDAARAWPTVDLPDFGTPGGRARSSRAERYAARLDALRARADARAGTTASSCTRTASTAPTSRS